MKKVSFYHLLKKITNYVSFYILLKMIIDKVSFIQKDDKKVFFY